MKSIIIKGIISGIMAIVGFTLVGYNAGIGTAAGVFLVVWGNNISVSLGKEVRGGVMKFYRLGFKNLFQQEC